MVIIIIILYKLFQYLFIVIYLGCSDINIRPKNSNPITVLSSTSTKSTVKSSPLAISTTTITTIKSLITTNIISSNSNIKCPKGDGYYATQGCTGYYKCFSSGTQITAVILCPAGLLFDVSINICNWASSVVCTA